MRTCTRASGPHFICCVPIQQMSLLIQDSSVASLLWPQPSSQPFRGHHDPQDIWELFVLMVFCSAIPWKQSGGGIVLKLGL